MSGRAKWSLAQRFWAHVEIRGPDECWPWKSGRAGIHPSFRAGGKTRRASLIAFMFTTGRWADYLRHSCDNPPCCNPGHLIEGTHTDNMRDKVTHGRQPRGEAHGRSRLTEAEVIAIRADLRGCRRLARAFGVSVSHVVRIRARRTWQHIP
jgi:hypothetical protein